MDKIKELILKKPMVFLLISAAYILSAGLLKWGIHPVLNTLWFLIGGAIGVYFLDGAELFFQLNPSPFRSVLFFALFVVVSLFIVTSSGSTLASGLVLSLYLQLVLWQIGEWRITGNLSGWYRMIASPVMPNIQLAILSLSGVVFVLETYFFVH